MTEKNPKTILLVEDELTIAMVTSKILQKFGYNVITASTGEEAVDSVKSDIKIDLVLMDIDLGKGIDGTEAADVILKDHDIPVVFLSSHTEPEIVEKTEKITSYGYVVKNSSNTVLDASIKMAFKLFEAKLNEKRKEESLLEAYQFNERIIQGAEEGIIVYDLDLRYRVWNTFMENITGIPADKALGKYPLELFPFLKDNGVMERLEKALKGEAVDSVDFPFHISESGKSGWSTDSSATLRNAKGEIIGVIGMVKDITKRKQTEQDLFESEANLRQAQQITQIGNWSWDLLTNRIRWSDEMFNIFGLDKVAGPNVEKVRQLILTEDLPIYDSAFEGLETGKIRETIEYRISQSDGKIHWLIARAKAEFDITGNVVRLFGTIQDITEQKRAEEELLKYQTLLKSSLESFKDVIVLSIDENYNYLYFNKAHIESMKYAYNKDIEIGMNLLDCMKGEEDIRIAKENYDRALAGESHSTVQVYGNAERSYYESLYSPIRNEKNKIIGASAMARDITERKNAEEALREREAKFKSYVENAPYGVFIVNEKGHYLEVNKAACKITGYTEDELINLSIPELTQEEDLEKAIINFQTVMKDGFSSDEVGFVTKSGEKKIWKVDAVKLSETRFLGFATDITERKLAEAELKESESRFRSIIEASPVPFALNDEQQNITYLNYAFIKTFGYDRSDIPTLSDWWPKAYPDIEYRDWVAVQWQARMEESKKTGTPFKPLELKIRSKDNSQRIVMVSAVPLKEKFKDNYLVVLYDITEHKQAEMQLMSEKQKIANILEGTNVGTWEWNVQTGDTVFNERWAEIIGYNLAEISPVSIETWMKFTHPDDLKQSGELLEKHFKGELEYYHFEARMKHKDGHWVWVLDRGKVTSWTEDGKPLMMFGTHQDITESKQAEEKIKSLLQEKELLLREVHHRIKNHMNMIIGLFMLQEETLTEPSAIEALQDAQNRARSMMVLYDKLYRTDDYQELPINVYLSTLIDEVIENFSNKHTVKIQKNLEDLILHSEILFPLGIIVNEILTNAMKYAFKENDDGLITINFSTQDGKSRLIIQDHGVGIPDSITIEDSTGFGIQLIKLMTKQIHGKIEMERNNGTKFIIEFG